MGFLNIFRGRKNETQEQPPSTPMSLELDADSIKGWISQNYGNDIERERKEFTRMSSDVMQSINDLRKLVYGIRKGNFQEGDKTYAAINMIKDTWAKKAALSISSYERDVNLNSIQKGDTDFPLFRDMFHRTVKLMEEAGMIPKQRMVMGRFFEKESAKLADIFSSLGKKLEVMRECINGKSALKNMSTLERLTNELSQLSDELHEMNSRKDEHLANIEDAKAVLSKSENRLQTLLKSSEWSELEKTEKAYEDCRKAMDDIENTIIGKLGDVKRLLKLFAHDCAKTDRKQKTMAEKFSESPVKTFFDSDPGELQELFKTVLFKERSGDFRVSGKDMSKLKSLSNIVESGWLAVKKAEYEGKKDMCADYKKQMGGISVHMEKRDAERSIEKAKADVTGFERDTVSIEEKINEKEKVIESKRREIRDYISSEMGLEVLLK